MEKVALREKTKRTDEFGQEGQAQNQVGPRLKKQIIFNLGQQNHSNYQDPKNTISQIFELIKLFRIPILAVLVIWLIVIPAIMLIIILTTFILGSWTGNWEPFDKFIKILPVINKC